MENESTPSATNKAAKPKVGVTFRIETSDLDKFKAICTSRGISQSKQFVEWIRTDQPWRNLEINPSTNDSAI